MESMPRPVRYSSWQFGFWAAETGVPGAVPDRTAFRSTAGGS